MTLSGAVGPVPYFLSHASKRRTTAHTFVHAFGNIFENLSRELSSSTSSHVGACAMKVVERPTTNHGTTLRGNASRGGNFWQQWAVPYLPSGFASCMSFVDAGGRWRVVCCQRPHSFFVLLERAGGVSLSPHRTHFGVDYLYPHLLYDLCRTYIVQIMQIIQLPPGNMGSKSYKSGMYRPRGM